MWIRKASDADFDAMWAIFQSVVATGDTLPFSSAAGDEFFHAQWLGHGSESFVVLLGTTLCGMYKYGPNLPGLGSHVASATYLVSPESQGRGIGRAMVEHSLAQAGQAGFVAMQFNYVVATNKPAIRLYEKLGFSIVGTLPKAFRHQQLGLVDAYVMHRFLGAADG